MRLLPLLSLPLFLLLISTPAGAVDFSKVLNDTEGKPLKVCAEQQENKCVREVEVTLGYAVRNALYASFPDEQNLSGEDKFKRAVLAQATTQTGDIKISAEDTALIKKLVAKFYGPLVVYQVWSLVDPPK